MVLVTANVRQVDGEWEAVAHADKPYRVAAATEDAVKAAFIEYYYTEYSKIEPDAFSEPLTADEVDWTYRRDG
ncbi:MAG TPA: hypothetical protein VGP26_24520 [Actinophytocola sp.]|jgi:hypothetical protein|nr:hypothetical protein [Actinophytocola sp.]